MIFNSKDHKNKNKMIREDFISNGSKSSTLLRGGNNNGGLRLRFKEGRKEERKKRDRR